jgi:thymidylate kinase
MLNKKLAKSLIICFLGPDGSGKSTVIELLKKESSFEEIHYFHLKPIYKKKSSDKIVENPHRHKTYSPIKSYIKLIFLFFQYNIGWLKNILPLKNKSSLVIFDRYYDDILVDYKRYRYGGCSFAVNFIRFFIPKPDIYFILTADANIINNRKQEVSLEELKRQIKAYRNLADNSKYINIDANKDPSEIISKITNIIIKKSDEKY